MEWKALMTAVVAGYILARRWYERISKILEPVIKEVEALAIDGKIDKADRKKVAMTAVEQLEKEKIIRLSFVSRWIVSLVIDKLAGKLPDYNVQKNIARVVG